MHRAAVNERWRRLFEWPRTWGWGRAGANPDTTRLHGVRLRLTLWYSLVLAVALVLAGVVLYVGVARTIMQPVDRRLVLNAEDLTVFWQDSPEPTLAVFCTHPQPSVPVVQSRFLELPPDLETHLALRTLLSHLAAQPYRACYDANGALLRQTSGTQGIDRFVSTSFALKAIHAGSALDTIDGGPGAGPVRRYAVPVPAPDGQGILGVVEIGAKVTAETSSLRQLLGVMLLVGPLILVGAAAGGLFLAGRAFVPVRRAFTRQQAFVADASHELRTPLTLMRADAEVLLRGRERLDPDDAMLLEDIVAETEHMSVLTTNLLTLARLDARRVTPERKLVDLAEIARTVTRRAAALAGAAGVDVRVEADGPAAVMGDPQMLEQAALILLDNGIKYNRPGGSVVVRTSRQDGRAVLRVRDTGIGVPPEHLPHLGERFYRVDKARSREAGGAGLGLSIAHGIAALHGGALTLASTPDRGTTATLTLPAARAHDTNPFSSAPA